VSAQTKIDETALKALHGEDKTVVVVDVRTAEEYAAGHLPMAKLLPFDAIDAQSAAKLLPKLTTKVVVYCHSGRRSGIAAQTLKSLGYTVIDDFGAMANWQGPLATGTAKL
jgi:rhodanese-related sulfurtransferase